MEENKTNESLEGMKEEAVKSVISVDKLIDEGGIMDMSADEFREILADLRKTNQEQADYAKRAWIMSLISTIAVLIVALFIMLYGAFLMPKVNSLLDEAQISLTNVTEITDKLSKVDFEGLIDDVGGLVITTEKDLGITMKKIDEIDFKGLNRSIGDLGDVIEPLAKFFNGLSGKPSSSGSGDTKQEKKNNNDFNIFNLLQ